MSNYTQKKRRNLKKEQDLIRIQSRMANITKVIGSRPVRSGKVVKSVLSLLLKRKQTIHVNIYLRNLLLCFGAIKGNILEAELDDFLRSFPIGILLLCKY